MKTRIDAEFVREAEHFRLVFTCEQCAHFVPESNECAHGYPNDAHRAAPLERGQSIEFCKEFELG